MTLNQLVSKIRSVCLSHKQIRSFFRGYQTDWLVDHVRKYPAAVLEYTAGNVATNGVMSLSFRLSLYDLVHVASETMLNEQDVDSDMVQIMLDIVAQLNYGNFLDARISVDNSLTLLEPSEHGDDMAGGCSLDFIIRMPYTQNVCAVPTELINYDPTDSDMKLVFDLIYTSNGTEGSSLTIPALSGKRILFVSRESSPLYKVSANPGSSEFSFNGTDITLGAPVNPNSNERFLFLYGNY